jgi:drug/metabolite transporter (DMT)-like permease
MRAGAGASSDIIVLCLADALAVTPATRRTGLAMAASGAILFSAKAILAKLHYRYGVDALDVLALRMAFSAPLFALLAVRETARARARGQSLSRRDLGLIAVLGLLGYYLSSLLDFWGLEYVPVSLERLILFLNPTFVLLIGLLAFARPVSRRQWLAMAISYAGVALVFAENLRLTGDHVVLGSVLVLGAALSYALYLALSGELVQRIGSLRLVAYAMGVSTVATLAHFLFARHAATLLAQPWEIYLLALANAVFCTFLPVTLTMAAIARIGAGSTAQLSALGPVSLVFLGGWILGEPITALQIAGTVVVLGSVWVLTGAGSKPGANSVPVGK